MKKVFIISVSTLFVIVGNALAINFSSNVSFIGLNARPLNESMILLFFGIGMIGLASVTRNNSQK